MIRPGSRRCWLHRRRGVRRNGRPFLLTLKSLNYETICPGEGSIFQITNGETLINWSKIVGTTWRRIIGTEVAVFTEETNHFCGGQYSKFWSTGDGYELLHCACLGGTKSRFSAKSDFHHRGKHSIATWLNWCQSCVPKWHCAIFNNHHIKYHSFVSSSFSDIITRSVNEESFTPYLAIFQW